MSSNTVKPATNEGLQMNEEVRVYLDGLLEDAGLKATDEMLNDELCKELYARLDHYIAKVIVEHLPAERLDEFVKMNEERKPKTEIEKFFKTHVPNYEEVFTTALADFRQMYLGTTAAVKNSSDGTPKNSSPIKKEE
jgi:hypothetical protein